MLWRVGQILIVLAVLWGNIYFQFTDNPLIACAWAFMAAYGITVFPYWVSDQLEARRVRRQNARHSSRQSPPVRGRLVEPFEKR